MHSRLRLTRRQIPAFRRGVGGLEERIPSGPASSRRAAWAGWQDSMPRAALLSAHLGGRRMTDREAARAPDIGNSIRYAATTGTVAIRREGARAPTIWTVPAPGLEPDEGRAVDVLRARPGAPDETESYVRGSGWVRGS